MEEAEGFVNVAQLKLGSTIGKQYAKGLNAKLTGARIDLTSDGPLVDKLRNAISVSSVFLVFYGDRAISVSDFYLATGYRYKADYPMAWSNDQAFNYLRKKPD